VRHPELFFPAFSERKKKKVAKSTRVSLRGQDVWDDPKPAFLSLLGHKPF